MPTNIDFDQALGDKTALKVGVQILLAGAEHRQWNKFAEYIVSLIRSELNAESVSLVHGIKGLWRIVAATPGAKPLPEELLANVLDNGATDHSNSHVATPLFCSQMPGALLLVKKANADTGLIDSISSISGIVGCYVEQFLTHQSESNQIAWLEKLLELTSSWNQSQKTDELLEAMAESATELLHCERATVFLWKRDTKKLIGRPALGVEGNQLTIDDNVGVVGEVVKTARPLRVDEDILQEQAQIDRRVDQKLEFKTRSLLCVPLLSSKGDVQGAFELINKIGGNFIADDEASLVEMARHAALAIENTRHLEHLAESHEQIVNQAAGQIQMIGHCPAIKSLASTIDRVAKTDLSVLILGENGTGKEVAARMVHYRSPRRGEVLVAVNCAALSETLLESELFGHEKGAFTDAHEMRRGKFELADGGTLFLDEIGDMSLGGQAKLLRVLEEKLVVRVGGSVSIPTDTRVIAATNQNLAELVRQKKFREDLFFRLNVVTIDMPALRERDEDVIILAEHFLSDFSVNSGRKMPKLTTAAKKRLKSHSWPGNVRELRNMMERLAYLSTDDRIDADELAFIMSPAQSSDTEFPVDMALPDATRDFQVFYIQRQIDRNNGNMTEAAKSLGLHRSNLYRKMKQLGMDVT
jgi:transcriptional regulator with GAF, ATPase, and Fis domain